MFRGTIMPIIRSSKVLYRRLLSVVFRALAFKLSVWCWVEGYVSGLQPANRTRPHHTDNLKIKAPNTTGSNLLYNTLELLMLDTMVPETCWASNKICNKNKLLHLVGILFPHIKTYRPYTSSRKISVFFSASCHKVSLLETKTPLNNRLFGLESVWRKWRREKTLPLPRF